MSRTDLAQAMGTTNQNIYYLIKSGKASSETMKRLADAFSLPVSEFIKLGEE
jgi:plasmid maintenance system antidote protein VapI